jgi:hypothetical protein
MMFPYPRCAATTAIQEMAMVYNQQTWFCSKDIHACSISLRAAKNSALKFIINHINQPLSTNETLSSVKKINVGVLRIW